MQWGIVLHKKISLIKQNSKSMVIWQSFFPYTFWWNHSRKGKKCEFCLTSRFQAVSRQSGNRPIKALCLASEASQEHFRKNQEVSFRFFFPFSSYHAKRWSPPSPKNRSQQDKLSWIDIQIQSHTLINRYLKLYVNHIICRCTWRQEKDGVLLYRKPIQFKYLLKDCKSIHGKFLKQNYSNLILSFFIQNRKNKSEFAAQLCVYIFLSYWISYENFGLGSIS